MGWRYSLHYSRDGRQEAELSPVSPGSWSRRLWYKGSGSHEFFVADSTDSPGGSYEIWGLTNAFPGSRVIVVSWELEDGTLDPVYAGVVWSLNYSYASRIVTVSHEDIWSIWEKRFLSGRVEAIGDDNTRTMETWLDLSGLSFHSWVTGIVQWGMTTALPGENTGGLSINYTRTRSSGSFGRRYWSYEFTSVSDALSEVSEFAPESVVDFAPSFRRSGLFQWSLVARSSPPRRVSLNATAPGSPVSGLSIEHDSSEYANEVNVTGSGSETETPYYYRWAGGGEPNRVHLAVHESRSELTRTADLDAASRGIFGERRRSAQQIECSVQLGGESGYSPRDFPLGSTVELLVSGDPVFPDRMDLTLIGIRSDGDRSLRLEFSSVDVFQG